MSDNHQPDQSWTQPPQSDAYGYGQQNAYGQQNPSGYDQQYQSGYAPQYQSGFDPQNQSGYAQQYPAGYPQQSFQPGGTPALDQPYYGIGFIAAMKRAFTKYARFEGRASRGEYWWFALGNVIIFFGIGLLAGIAAAVFGHPSTSGDTSVGVVAGILITLLALYTLAVIIPSLSLLVRRLHDAGYSGLLALITLVPYLGSFVLQIMCILPSSPAGARYDPAPAGWYPPAG